MKTAVEWLEEMLTISLGEHHMSLFINEFNKAKKMEKEQMRSDFWHHRRITGYEILKDEVKTFKQQEQ